jgi:hypothetical protein
MLQGIIQWLNYFVRSDGTPVYTKSGGSKNFSCLLCILDSVLSHSLNFISLILHSQQLVRLLSLSRPFRVPATAFVYILEAFLLDIYVCAV